MAKIHDIRDIVISHYKDGKKAPEIANLLANKVHRSTIDRWLHRYKQSGSIYVKRNPGRPRTGRTKKTYLSCEKKT
jgi:transposase